MIYLLGGNNSYNSWNKVNELGSTFKNIQIIDGSKVADLNEIFINLDSLSLFQNSAKITITKRFLSNKKKALAGQLVESLKKTSIDTFELVFWEDGPVDKRSGLYKFIKKKGKVFEYDFLKPLELRKWIKEYIEDSGYAIENGLIDKLIYKVGVDQYLLVSEMDKLFLYMKSQKRKKIGEKDIECISVYSHEESIWDLMDAISLRDRGQMLKIIENMMAQTDDSQYLITMIARQLKIIYLINQPDLSSFEISKRLKIHPFTLSKASKYRTKYNLQKIKKLYSKLVDLDFAIKQGKIEPRLGLSLFVSSI